MPDRYVIMGVAGAGKSTIGEALARKLNARYLDGDDLHSKADIAKMARGEPLTDEDRAPWLADIALALSAATSTVIVGCSALKRSYRDMIRDTAGSPVTFIYLFGTRDVLLARMRNRSGHFMPVGLLDSQLETLEPPENDEDWIGADIDQTVDEIVGALLRGISERNTAARVR